MNQLADDNEQYQDLLEELKSERQTVEAELTEKIRCLELKLEEKSQSATPNDVIGSPSNPHDVINELKAQIATLHSELNILRVAAAVAEELKRENENLVDMIRQLSTTGTLDAPTIQRLKNEMTQSSDTFQSNDVPDVSDDIIDWHAAFNDLQIEVEYLRSQNAMFLSKMQSAGLSLDGMYLSEDEISSDPSDAGKLRLEFDRAVRSLHERDMRCQELTWEITKVIFVREFIQKVHHLCDFIYFRLISVTGRARHASIAIV